jgi:hypothetical protein
MLVIWGYLGLPTHGANANRCRGSSTCLALGQERHFIGGSDRTTLLGPMKRTSKEDDSLRSSVSDRPAEKQQTGCPDGQGNQTQEDDPATPCQIWPFATIVPTICRLDEHVAAVHLTVRLNDDGRPRIGKERQHDR